MDSTENRPTTKLQLNMWLTLIFLAINTIIVSAVFMILYSNLKDDLIIRTHDQLTSVNILKKRLLNQFLQDKYEEASHIINFYKASPSTTADLEQRLRTIDNTVSITWIEDSLWNHSEKFYAVYDESNILFNFYFDLDKKDLNVVLSLDSVRSILKERTGLGLTGESYLVSENRYMMTPSIFFPERAPNMIECNTIGANYAFMGLEGVEAYDDYREVSILGSYRLLEFKGIKAALLTEIDYEEAMEPVWELREKMVAIHIGVLFFLLLMSMLTAYFLSRPVVELRKITSSLSRGSLPNTLPSPGPVYEFSEITSSIGQLIRSLKQTVYFAHEIGRGNLNIQYERLSDKDELGTAIIKMRDQLISLDNEKKKLEMQGKKILIDTQEKEREMFARELHDGLGALLTTMKLKMDSIGLKDKRANELKELLDKTILETRSLARNMMPSVLMDFGLNETLNQFMHDIRSNTSIEIKFINELEKSKTILDKGKSVGIYRIAQEAINNALKHAKCTQIIFSVTEFDDHIVLYIKDNGKGFNVANTAEAGLGLKNMEERTRTMDGQLMIESNEEGTVIEVIIPLQS